MNRNCLTKAYLVKEYFESPLHL